MKMIKKGILSFAIAIFSIAAANAQNTTDLRFNEIMSNNVSGWINNSGQHCGWIEIFNPSYGSVDIGGCYLTDDKSNPKKYRIPQNDNSTKIGLRQYIVLFADGVESNGVLYTNFRLNPNGGYLALYSSDGRTKVDEITYPALPENVTYAKIDDEEKDNYGTWTTESRVTPGMRNIAHPDITQAEKYGQSDPNGVVMALTAMSVVFCVLALLSIAFKLLGMYNIKLSKKKAAAAHGVDVKSEQISHVGEESGDIYAAIALALQLYQDDLHDNEDMIITIEKEDKFYSPWSSKRQIFRQTPRVQQQPKAPIGKMQK